MDNKVLSIVEINGVYSLELGNNVENIAFQNLQKNWGKLDSFEGNENQSIGSLIGFCRNYLQPALSLMNDGGIGRQIANKIKTTEELKADAEELRNSIYLEFNGVEGNKENKEDNEKLIRTKKGLEEKIASFADRKWKLSNDLDKAKFNLEFQKNKQFINDINDKIEKYLDDEYAIQSDLENFIDRAKKLENSLQFSYNKNIKLA